MRNSKHKDKKMYAVQILNKTFIKNIYNYLLLFFLNTVCSRVPEVTIPLIIE